ncbi:MAG: cation-transporting P-type ATPase [Candidatus Levybacteria bacterium]|nr:cation-transporting P-type ATPase [Candidatus Levybacteria bacterium]
MKKEIIGLSDIEAAKRLKEYGPNEIKEVSKTSPFRILFRQIRKNFIFYLLLAAAIISFAVGKQITGAVILGVVFLVVSTGFIQEYRAEKAIAALKKMILPLTAVVRNGEEKEISTTEIVVGDILVLRSGEKIPADCILIEGEDVEVNEAVLTGESADIEKREVLSEDKYDKKNMLYMGSFLVNGKCFAKVIHTGMDTKFGQIAGLISTVEKELPLQDKVNSISKVMVGIAISISLATGAIMLMRVPSLSAEHITEILILIIALSVSAFPEGFPVVLITTLAVGAQRMAKQNAIVNRMSIIETLGETTIICTDKTGTLTVGEMTVRKIIIDKDIYLVSGVGYKSEGRIEKNNNSIDIKNDKYLSLLIRASILCNDSKIEKEKDGDEYSVLGNQTEGALLILGIKAGIFADSFNAERKQETPFSPERKMMSVLIKEGSGNFVYAKGATEIIIGKCKKTIENGQEVGLTEERKKDILRINSQLSEKALRTLAIAYKPNDGSATDYSEENLVFLGIVALEDPPRDEIKESIDICRKAQIKVKMITGDSSETAEAIGKQVDITGNILTGEQIDKMSDEELKSAVLDTAIFARVNPEHKLRLVRSLKKNGEIVTMTGDGVNDAPALKEAHIGVAMGKNGTDVTRSVADLTLKDDNFATIVSAIREGRTIFNNIRKFVTYQLCDNFAELSIIFVGVLLSPILGWEVPVLLALQILFLNLVTDNMPAITLGLNPSSGDIMTYPPRKRSSILNKLHIGVIIFLGSFMAVSALLVYYITFNIFGQSTDVARTSALVTIILLEVVNAYSFRSFRKRVLTRSLFINKYLFIASILSISATILILYTPARTVFSTAPLSPALWLLPLFSAFIILLIQDIFKSLPSEKVKSFIKALSA